MFLQITSFDRLPSSPSSSAKASEDKRLRRASRTNGIEKLNPPWPVLVQITVGRKLIYLAAFVGGASGSYACSEPFFSKEGIKYRDQSDAMMKYALGKELSASQ